MARSDDTRRRFIAHLAAAGPSSTLAPSAMWAKVQDRGADRVTLQMVTDVSPPCHFSPVVAATTVDKTRQPRPPRHPRPPGQQHSQLANLACYPAINVPNGFAEGGTPTSIVFFDPPYRELALLALAKAYQDRVRWHERAPALA